MDRLKAIDFFCGAGGMTYGMNQAGITVLAGIDIDKSCKETYEANNHPSRFINEDISTLNYKKLGYKLDIRKNDDHLILIGCSPCQYWSKVNTDRSSSETSAYLLHEFQRAIQHFNPGHVVIENVPGILKNNKYKLIPSFKTFLKSMGFNVVDGKINANNYGVPQNRIRYLLWASRVIRDVSLPPNAAVAAALVRDFIGEHNGFSRIEAGHRDHTDFLHTSSELSEKNLRRIMCTPADGGNRHSWKDIPELQINAYRNKDHIFRDVYGRMFWDKPAPTLTTRFNSLSNGRFGHPEEHRAISLREGAALQTFPKHYIFKASNQASIARQIGNAVPPDMAKKMGLHIKQMVNYG